MEYSRLFLTVVVWAVTSLTIFAGSNRGQADAKRAEIEAFNQKYIAAHLKMDNAMVSSFWAEDGVSLLPEMAPLVGKKAIDKFFDAAVAPLAGYHMEKMEIDFREIQMMGDWAYEWGLEHQVLQPPGGKPQIESRGNILLILHRNANGGWKIKQEMWNAAPKPATEHTAP
ncbi:MAG TPA: SgcJ/EcaC family oxidoreductase [Candidatus Acidoferrum sp.]|nr:SgcJ/EcaC family oxidoreductase [Candidatus Acidoferrum sp.]